MSSVLSNLKSRNSYTGIYPEVGVSPEGSTMAVGSVIVNGCPATEPVPRENVKVAPSASFPCETIVLSS